MRGIVVAWEVSEVMAVRKSESGGVVGRDYSNKAVDHYSSSVDRTVGIIFGILRHDEPGRAQKVTVEECGTDSDML